MSERGRRLGKKQLDLLANLGGITMALVVGDKRSESLVRRGLLAAEPDGSFAHITAAGLRALADEIDAGRAQEHSIERLKASRMAMADPEDDPEAPHA